jgi:hypothetical protein
LNILQFPTKRDPYFILDPGGNPGTTTGSGAEFGTVDKSGNVFAGEPRPRVLRKYVKVR